MGVLMAMGRPKAVLVLSPQQREQLEALGSSRSLPAGLVSRARIILGNYIVHSLDFGLSLACDARLFLRALRFAAFVFIFGRYASTTSVI
jgi:hypothetical protein